jgi:hypothetical protein
MGKPRTLANTVSTGGPLADGAIGISEVTGLQAALDAKSSLVSGTAITTNGADSYSFTGIPASAKNIKLLLRGVSVNAAATTSAIQVQLGTSGGLVTSGYVMTLNTLDSSTASSISFTSAFLVSVTGADANVFSGILDFAEIAPNVWVESGKVKANTTRSHMGCGDVDLGAELTTITVFVGVGAFDGGTINIFYE